ncbi:hypothetical protein CVD27_14840 [Neobacillus cucumis]|uniref:Uncharacterized protein n=2 Tax=Neobacillus cucumis TaxID=1740721 RepID=A0A2N5HD28_9BACI|nr:hypothetical protein CVD27_14840 [Neobacillus cucumis]
MVADVQKERKEATPLTIDITAIEEFLLFTYLEHLMDGFMALWSRSRPGLSKEIRLSLHHKHLT